MSEGFVSLQNLGAGAVAEIFDHELARVLSNIMDPNTDPKAKREVTLKLVIKPNQDRDFGKVVVSASSKLAPIVPFETQVAIGTVDGESVASEYNPRQISFTEAQKAQNAQNVIPMERKESNDTAGN